MNYYSTYFDRNYLIRALVLHDSLAKWDGSFRLFALCMDEESYAAVNELGSDTFIPIRLRALEMADPDLARSRSGRSTIEYYYTCGPAFLLYLLSLYPEIGLITHVDADMCFFSSPEPVFEELAEFSIGITEHRFSKKNEERLRFGRFNVGWLSFRRDTEGQACLAQWRERCIEWCYERFEGDKYADQKYLDAWPGSFRKLRIIGHKGVNVGPWNLDRFPITENDGRIYVGGEPLVCFHFHGFKQLLPFLFDTNLARSGIIVPRTVRNLICGTYVEGLQRHAAGRRLTGSVRTRPWLMRTLRNARNIFMALRSRGFLLRIGGRVV